MSQNTTATQLDSLKKERSGALYDLMDALDSSAYDETAQGEENYILAQNKLWVITGEVASFSDQITALTQQATTVQSQLGNPPLRPGTSSAAPPPDGSTPGRMTSSRWMLPVLRPI